MFAGFICHIKETMKLKFCYAKKDYRSNMDRESGLHFYLRIKHFSLYLSLPMYWRQFHYMDRAMNVIGKGCWGIWITSALWECSILFHMVGVDLFQVFSSTKVIRVVMWILCTLQLPHFLLTRPPHLQSFWKPRHWCQRKRWCLLFLLIIIFLPSMLHCSYLTVYLWTIPVYFQVNFKVIHSALN